MKTLEERISRALYEIDPMGLCCKENEATDEYDNEADALVRKLQAGVEIREAIVTVFQYWFGTPFDEKVSYHTIESMCRRIEEAVAKPVTVSFH